MPGRSGAGETITTVGFDDAAVGAECTGALEERGGADANLGSQFGERAFKDAFVARIAKLDPPATG